MHNFTVNTIKILRPQVCVTLYSKYVFHHPLIIFNQQNNVITDYINMEKETINDIIKLNNSFNRKFLQLKINVPEDDIYKLDNNLIGYQFRREYLFSSIKLDNNLKPYHNLSNKENTNNESVFTYNKNFFSVV